MTTIKAERMARDLDTMVNVVNSDPGHIARAKAKRAKVLAQEEKRERMPGLRTSVSVSSLASASGH